MLALAGVVQCGPPSSLGRPSRRDRRRDTPRTPRRPRPSVALRSRLRYRRRSGSPTLGAARRRLGGRGERKRRRGGATWTPSDRRRDTARQGGTPTRAPNEHRYHQQAEHRRLTRPPARNPHNSSTRASDHRHLHTHNLLHHGSTAPRLGRLQQVQYVQPSDSTQQQQQQHASTARDLT